MVINQKQVFFHYQDGSLVDHRAYKPYTLVGPPALRLVLDPLTVIFLDNRLGLCMHYPDPYTSFIKFHEINNRALPADLLVYKHSIQ